MNVSTIPCVIEMSVDFHNLYVRYRENFDVTFNVIKIVIFFT